MYFPFEYPLVLTLSSVAIERLTGLDTLHWNHANLSSRLFTFP